MPPYIAFLLWLILLVCLFRYDPAKDRGLSSSLWVPFVSMFLLASRSPAQWLGASTTFEEGNSIDHVVYLTLTVLALRVLFTRHLNWRAATAANSTLTVLLLVSLLSVIWADYPMVTFRRWIREAGNYLMVLVVLSEQQPLKAIEATIRRLSYLLISLSVLLIKYFRDVGVIYNEWTGAAQFVGPTGGKNSLGLVCLIAGLFFFWDALRRWPDRRLRNVKRILFVDVVFIVMTLWLLQLSESATSRLCFVIGCLIVALVRYGSRTARINLARTLPFAACLLAFLEYSFGLSDALTGLMGRDPTLTGRTEIWEALLRARTNPLLGVGFSSFWLGERMSSLWRETKLMYLFNAHNGYLEMYLELGIVGLSILCTFLVVSYRRICRRLTSSVEFASLSLGFWVVLVVYNITEDAFRSNPLWITFLLFAIALPMSSNKVSPRQETNGEGGRIANGAGNGPNTIPSLRSARAPQEFMVLPASKQLRHPR
jgi:exopolysaccharide production protein ExoQ